jgi:hypothetical protein
MARYVAPDRGVRETVIGEKTYRPDKSGIYNVESASHARAMKAEGFFEASLNPYDKKARQGQMKQNWKKIESEEGSQYDITKQLESKEIL